MRVLTPEDLPLLAQDRGTQPQDLKRLSERHHALARALAMGMSEGEAAALTGYVSSRVSILKSSPAFQELVELYRANVDRIFHDTAARLSGLAHDAVVEIADRLETKPEEIPTGQLLEIAKMAADRSGLGPQSTQRTEVVNIGERIERARQRALALRRGSLIEDAEIIPPEAAE